MSERLIDGLTVKLPQNVRDALKNMARDNDKSMSEVAREYIIDGLKADGITEEADHGNDLGEGDQLLDEGQSERLNGRIHELEADEMIGEVQRYMKETVKVDLDLSNAIAFMYGAWKDLIVEEALCRGEEPPTLKEF